MVSEIRRRRERLLSECQTLGCLHKLQPIGYGRSVKRRERRADRRRDANQSQGRGGSREIPKSRRVGGRSALNGEILGGGTFTGRAREDVRPRYKAKCQKGRIQKEKGKGQGDTSKFEERESRVIKGDLPREGNHSGGRPGARKGGANSREFPPQMAKIGGEIEKNLTNRREPLERNSGGNFKKT